MARYITTTLPYVNANPHIGFAVELVQADALARAWRAQGEEVFFSTGTDEHGQKIAQAAEKAGENPQEFSDRFAQTFETLKGALAITNDAFIRTTNPAHRAAAQEMWRRCAAAGDIYKKSYTGLYCVGCEAYKTEKDLDEDGRCVDHPHLVPEEITEENYFFKFSKYQDALVAYLAHEDSVVPAWRRQEALRFAQAGLEDFSISRDVARLSWGIPVPDDDTQVMYVWFDALTNYISTLGWPNETGNFDTFWNNGTVLQVAGKDQVRFQSLMFQAMLMSANIKNTDTVFYHGFITSGGQKMSKSLGNVINPHELVERYGTEATRYILLRHVHPADDSDVTWERMDEWYTAHLVNGLGNLVARVMKLAEAYLGAPVDIEAVDTKIDEGYAEALSAFRFNDAMDYIFSVVAEGDVYMTAEEPFRKVKSDDATVRTSAQHDLQYLVRRLAHIAVHLAPFMPDTSTAIHAALSTNTKPENLFPRLA